MERLHKQISMFRDMEDLVVFAVILLAASYVAYNTGLMNGRLGL